MTIHGSIGFQVRDGEAIATASQCGDIVLAALVALEDDTLTNIPASAELNCPALSGRVGGISSNVSSWQCPPGLMLENSNSTPMCLKRKCYNVYSP